jgi:hypothetical protein
VSPAEREVIARIVRESCAEQGIPLTVPAEVCAEVAKILEAAAGRARAGVAGARREPERLTEAIKQCRGRMAS